MKRSLLIFASLVLVTAPSMVFAHEDSVIQQSSASAPSAGCHFDRELERGLRGSDVSCLQSYLKSEGFMSKYVQSTGYYGALTEAAVKKWQSAQAHMVSGKFSAEDVSHYAQLMGFVKQVPPMHEEHKTIEVGKEIPSMAVSIQVTKDAMSGWNLKINPTGFKWAPEHASGAQVVGEGHAHLMVDGVKMARVYGDWFHIPKLSKGQHKVEVSLNGNDHSTYTVNGAEVSVSAMITEE